jgi:hypothetical protein
VATKGDVLRQVAQVANSRPCLHRSLVTAHHEIVVNVACSHAWDAPSVQAALPVRWDAAGRTGRRLAQGVMLRWRQLGAFPVLVLVVVVEPVFMRLEAVDEGVVLGPRMLGGVLRGRLIAAADVPAMDASAQVEPPAVGSREAFDAAGPAGRDGRVDGGTVGQAQVTTTTSVATLSMKAPLWGFRRPLGLAVIGTTLWTR